VIIKLCCKRFSFRIGTMHF